MAAIYPDHGWGGKEGQITDRLFRKKYEFARDKGKEMLDAALDGSERGSRRRPSKAFRSSFSIRSPGCGPTR